MPVINEKNTQNGLKKWEVDFSYLEENYSVFGNYILSSQGMFLEDIERLAEYYPTFIVSAGNPYKKWGTQASCRNCRDLYVFDRGMRCVNCETLPNSLSDQLKLMILVRIPILSGHCESDQEYSGRFFLTHLAKIAETNSQMKTLFDSYFITADNGRVYFAPPVRFYLPSHYNSVQPVVYVDKSYFRILNIPITHVYPQLNNLCLYFTWRRPPLFEVITSRVIPRITIDMILSSLNYKGCLQEALRKLRTNFHDIYNLIGKPEYAQFVESVLDQYGDV